MDYCMAFRNCLWVVLYQSLHTKSAYRYLLNISWSTKLLMRKVLWIVGRNKLWFTQGMMEWGVHVLLVKHLSCADLCTLSQPMMTMEFKGTQQCRKLKSLEDAQAASWDKIFHSIEYFIFSTTIKLSNFAWIQFDVILSCNECRGRL